MGDKPEKADEYGEVVTSIPTELALRQAEINATRALTTSVEKLTDRMDGFGKDLGEIKSKVTTIEARNFDHQISKLEAETEKAVNILHESNKVRDAKSETDKSAMNTRINFLEQQMAKFGAYVAVAGAIGGVALGVMATKVFGG